MNPILATIAIPKWRVHVLLKASKLLLVVNPVISEYRQVLQKNNTYPPSPLVNQQSNQSCWWQITNSGTCVFSTQSCAAVGLAVVRHYRSFSNHWMDKIISFRGVVYPSITTSQPKIEIHAFKSLNRCIYLNTTTQSDAIQNTCWDISNCT